MQIVHLSHLVFVLPQVFFCVVMIGKLRPTLGLSRKWSSSVARMTKVNLENASQPTGVSEAVQKLVGALKQPQLLQNWHDSSLDKNALVQHVHNVFQANQPISRAYLDTLLDAATEMMRKERNVVRVQVPEGAQVTVCGDTHGQYDDFCEIFTNKVAGMPSEVNRFVFNGDIADRGPRAVEIFATLLTMKVVRPDFIHILRGNHETEAMTRSFGFQKEAVRKYDRSMYDKFCRFFDSLPVAATIDNDVFVVHGGLGPKSFNLTLADLDKIDRFYEPEGDAVLDELLWADPRDHVDTFAPNLDRGGGVLFGEKVTKHFLVRNQLSLLVRSHEVQDHGFSVVHDNRCVTVFSAPNYCGVCKNKGAVLRFSRRAKAASDDQNAENDQQQLSVQVVQFDPKHPPKK